MPQCVTKNIRSNLLRWLLPLALLCINSPLFASVYIPSNNPDLPRISIDMQSKKVAFENWLLAFPALILVSQNTTFAGVHIHAEDEIQSLTTAFEQLEQGQRYIWIDECNRLAFLTPLAPANKGHEICILYGQRGMSPKWLPISQNKVTLDFQELFENVSFAKDDQQNNQLRALRTAVGDIPFALQNMATDAPLQRNVLMIAAGHKNGTSRLRTQTWADLSSGNDLILKNGLNLIGFRADGSAQILASVFNCDPQVQIANQKPWQSVINDTPQSFALYAVVAHDSGFCGQNAAILSPVYKDLPLQDIEKLGFRQPYIGLFSGKNVIAEYSNTTFGRISLLLRGQKGANADWLDAQDPLVGDIFAVDTGIRQPKIARDPAPRITNALLDGINFNTGTPCIFAPSSPNRASSQAISHLKKYVGASLFDMVEGSSGFWNVEDQGVWFGAPQGAISFALQGKDTQKITLRLDGSTYQGREMILALPAGENTPAVERVIAGNFTLDLEIDTRFIQNGTVSYPIKLLSDNWTCPTFEATANDSRILGFFVTAMQVLPTTQNVYSPTFTTPNITVEQLTETVLPGPITFQTPPPLPAAVCSNAPELYAITPRHNAYQIEKALPVYQAIEEGMLSFFGAWWPQAGKGYRMGAKRASFSLRLPSTDENIYMVLSGQNLSNNNAPDMQWRDITLPKQQITQANAIAFDLSELPRNFDIDLNLIAAPISIKCLTLADKTQIKAGPLIKTIKIMRQGSTRLIKTQNILPNS